MQKAEGVVWGHPEVVGFLYWVPGSRGISSLQWLVKGREERPVRT